MRPDFDISSSVRGNGIENVMIKVMHFEFQQSRPFGACHGEMGKNKSSGR